MRVYAYKPGVLVALDVDLLPGVTVPWVCEFAHDILGGEEPTIDTFRKSLADATRAFSTSVPPGRRFDPLPRIHHGDVAWEREADMVVISDHFSETCDESNLANSGHTIRVPTARMLEILRQASALVGEGLQPVDPRAIQLAKYLEDTKVVREAFARTMPPGVIGAEAETPGLWLFATKPVAPIPAAAPNSERMACVPLEFLRQLDALIRSGTQVLATAAKCVDEIATREASAQSMPAPEPAAAATPCPLTPTIERASNVYRDRPRLR